MCTPGTFLSEAQLILKLHRSRNRRNVVNKLSCTRSSTRISMATCDTGKGHSPLNTFRCTWSLLRVLYIKLEVLVLLYLGSQMVQFRWDQWTKTDYFVALTLLPVRGIFLKNRTSPCLLVWPYSFVQCTFIARYAVYRVCGLYLSRPQYCSPINGVLCCQVFKFYPPPPTINA